MSTTEEHLQQVGGNLIMQLLIQVAVLKAENDKLREGQRSESPVASRT